MNPVILYNNILDNATLTPCSTAPNFDVNYLTDLKDYTYWVPADLTSPCYITADCGSAQSADTLGIVSINLDTTGAQISLECSSDNFNTDIVTALSAFSPSSKVILKTFTPQTKQYWRLKIEGFSSAPFIAILMIGTRLELPYPPDAPYYLIDESVKVESNRSKRGHILGSIIQYKSYDIKCRVSLLDRSWVMNTFKPFWEAHGSDMKPFFFAWDLDNFPDIVYWAKFKDRAKFRVPLRINPYVESLDLEMEAIREEEC